MQYRAFNYYKVIVVDWGIKGKSIAERVFMFYDGNIIKQQKRNVFDVIMIVTSQSDVVWCKEEAHCIAM